MYITFSGNQDHPTRLSRVKTPLKPPALGKKYRIFGIFDWFYHLDRFSRTRMVETCEHLKYFHVILRN